MHAQDADADVDGVDVGVGEPLRDRAAAVAGPVGVRLPVHAGVVEDAADAARRYSASASRPAPYSLNTSPQPSRAEPFGRYGCGKYGIERGRAVRHQHLRRAQRVAQHQVVVGRLLRRDDLGQQRPEPLGLTPVVHELTSSLFTP